MQVPASGGVARLLTRVDTARKEMTHGVPQFLPDGKRFLYFIASADPNIQGVYAGSLDNPAQRLRVLATDRKADYSAPQVGRTGYLLWLRERTLLAQPFDEANLRLEGEPTPVAEGVSLSPLIRAAYWTSDAGLLVYRTGFEERSSKLVWFSRDGKRLGEAGKEGLYASFRMSSDGKRAALSLLGDGENRDVWVLEFARGVMTRLTFDPKEDGIPLWSPDGRHIAFYSNRTGNRQIYRKDAGGGGREEQLTTDAGDKFPSDWSPDGRFVLYIAPAAPAGGRGGGGLWALPVDGDRKPVEVDIGRRVTPGASAQFSPDGKWIAYASTDSGRSEVYVRSFPESGSPWQVSTQGGLAPKWRTDGKELFYMGPDRESILAAAVRTSGAIFQSDTPRELFRMTRIPDRIVSPYEVTLDGQRFLVLQPTADRGDVSPLTVLMNWQARLKK
jgi:dipeptidyl aminopeptidase/acylaminoacyl peptidase